MRRREISNHDDVIDSRDVIKRIEELESDLESAYDDEQKDADDGTTEPRTLPPFEEWIKATADNVDSPHQDDAAELQILRALAEEGEGSPDWSHGETLIRDSYFKQYAQELAEDCGMLEKADTWPGRCIDWDQAAEELQQDYMSVSFDGVDYWIRA